VVRRINITIPDALAERLDKVKAEMNVSQICATALEKAVYMREAIQHASGARQATIERLRGQRKESEDATTAAARKAATKWVHGKDVNFATIQLLIEELRLRSNSRVVTSSWREVLNEHAGDLLADYEEDIRDNEYDSNVFWHAFAAAVEKIWKQIEAEVKKDE